MYSFNTRVRYSEVGPDQRASLTTILNYFQDCSTFQSGDIGVGLDFLIPRHRAWLMSSWQIVVNRYPKLGEHLEVFTWPYGFNTFYGLRNFVLRDEEGNDIAYANSIWFYYDTVAGVPAKLKEEDMSAYVLEDKYDMDYAPRKIALPTDFEEFDAFPVHKSYLDNNMHVNNGVYIKLAEDYLPAGFVVRQMRSDYRSQARLGDMMHPRVTLEDGRCTVVLANDEGKPFVIVEFES